LPDPGVVSAGIAENLDMIEFKLNGKTVKVEADKSARLLWVVRDQLGLTGTKYGCGGGFCGACTVHLNGKAVRSCQVALSATAGTEVTTIEGLSPDRSHPLQEAWIAEQVPQCGYCQSGQIMQAATLLDRNPNPSREEIVQHMNGVICRCGTYTRIIAAIQRAAKEA